MKSPVALDEACCFVVVVIPKAVFVVAPKVDEACVVVAEDCPKAKPAELELAGVCPKANGAELGGALEAGALEVCPVKLNPPCVALLELTVVPLAGAPPKLNPPATDVVADEVVDDLAAALKPNPPFGLLGLAVLVVVPNEKLPELDAAVAAPPNALVVFAEVAAVAKALELDALITGPPGFNPPELEAPKLNPPVVVVVALGAEVVAAPKLKPPGALVLAGAVVATLNPPDVLAVAPVGTFD